MPRHPALERTLKTVNNNHNVNTGGEVMSRVGAQNPGVEIMPVIPEEAMVEISEEAEPLKVAPSPIMPSAAEIEEHRISHIPYRSWCRECVMGRGLGEKRGLHQGRDHGVAIVGIDYFYITTRGIEKRQEMTDAYPLDAEGRRT